MPRNRGKKAREKRQIATRELSMEERSALMDALIEPPLAVSYAIIGALTVEHELELSIKARLRKISQEEWETILSDHEGPLGSFDRKIKFAGYLGILDASVQTNLDIIRNVRNRFAHTKRLITFEHSFVADELTKIVSHKGQRKKFAQSKKMAPQWRFTMVCLHCIEAMSKKRFGNHAAAHKAWMKRRSQTPGTFSGLLGALGSRYAAIAPSSLPAAPPSRQTSKESGPNNLAPYGLLSGLLPYLDQKKEQT